MIAAFQNIDLTELRKLLPERVGCRLERYGVIENNELTGTSCDLVITARNNGGAILFQLRNGKWTTRYTLGCALELETVKQAVEATIIINQYLRWEEYECRMQVT